MRAKPSTSGFLGRLRSRVTKRLFVRLHRDERGHVAILYAVCMLFVSALVFFVIAVGRRYMQKETIQAAVDAAAFAGAAAEAKTLNSIAWCNLAVACGMAMVYTLNGLGGAIIGFIAAIGTLEAASLGTYCIGDAPDCAIVDSGIAEEIAARYEAAASELAGRIKTIANAAKELEKTGAILVAVEAEEVSMNDAYAKRLPGLVTVLDPIKPVIPAMDGAPNQVCGPSPQKEEYGLAFGPIGLLQLPKEIPPEGKLIIAGLSPAALAIGAAETCGGEYGVIPQILTPDWQTTARIKAVSFLDDSKPDDRRAYLVAAASQYGDAPEATAKWMLATSEASVYGYGGSKEEDLWHMDWRARLILSQAKDFGPLKFLTAGPLNAILDKVWIH